MKKRATHKIELPQVADDPSALALDFLYGLIERIRLGKLKKFDAVGIVQLRKLNTKQLVRVNNQFSHTAEDITAALDKDRYFIEAYSNFTKDQLKLILAYLKAVKALKPDKNANGKIRVMGQRKKRQRSPDVIVKRVLYLERDPETRQTSIHPRELVGAMELWVFNTKTRKLGCYYAKNESGLSAKGTTILDYDEKRSTTKTIRKPQQQVADFMKAGAKYWQSIKAVPQEISPRLNRETLILRVTGQNSNM